MHTRFSLVALTAVLLACQPAAPAGLTPADEQALRAADAAAVAMIVAKDWAGFAGTFAEDGTILPPNGEAVVGRAAIQAWAEAFPPINEFKAAASEVGGSGDLAYVQGTFSMTISPPGAPAPVSDNGRYIAIYRKQADGSWKVSRDIWNSSMPAPPPAQ